MAGEQARVGLADVADAERVDEARQRNAPARLDRAAQVAAFFLPQSGSASSCCRRSGSSARRNTSPGRRISPASKSCGTCLRPSPSISNAPRLTKWRSRSVICARQIRPPVQRRTASPGGRSAKLPRRAMIRKDKGLASGRPALVAHLDHLRDHVAGALDDHGIAEPDVLALDVVFVVQGGAGDHDAADGDRLERGHRCERAGAPHLHRDPDHLVSACSAANLNAIAQRGARPTKPRRRW